MYIGTVTDHYFSEKPATPAAERDIDVTIRDRDYRVTTSAGVFSHDGVDRGTQVLFRYAPTPPAGGVALDLGCGWGPISLALAAETEARIIAVDINERARHLTRMNAERAGATIEVLTPGEALEIVTETGITTLWSNPPVRIGKTALYELMETWLAHLRGQAHLVMSKNLGADSFASWLQGNYDVARLGTAKGFRVLQVSPRQQSQ